MIEVLLATYNGARFLREQIDSVLAQQNVEVKILARDDGSTDSTPAILAEYAQAHPNHFQLIPTGTPTGSAKSNFAQLLLASIAAYAAFCDQDDVWLPHKLQRTLQRMQQLEKHFGRDIPLLVSTDLRVVNNSLEPIAPSLWQQNQLHHPTDPLLSQLLSQNTVTGCTALLNRPLVQALQTVPAAALMHDHWAALVAAATGELAGIDEPTVLYRQHGGNVIGAITSRSPLQQLGRLLSRSAVQARAAQYASDRAQAKALLDQFGASMMPNARRTVQAFIELPSMDRFDRIRTVRRFNLWRPGLARKLTAVLDILRS